MIKFALGILRQTERAVAAALLVVTVTLVVVASAARYMGVPLVWTIEVVQAMFVWLCVISADLTLQRAGHFSVDMFANLLPRRARQALEIFNVLLSAALLATLAYYGFLFAYITSGRPLPMIGITSGVATMALPVGFVLMLITLAEHLIARIKGKPIVPAGDVVREVM